MGIGQWTVKVLLFCALAALLLIGCRVLQRAGVDRFAARLGRFLISPFVWAVRLAQATLDGLVPPVAAATRGLRDYTRGVGADWVIMWELVVYALSVAVGVLVVRADYDYSYMRFVPLFVSTGGSFDGDALSRQLALAFVLTGASLGLLVADLVGLTPTGGSILFHGLTGRTRKVALVALIAALGVFILDAALLALYGIEASLGTIDSTTLGVTLVLFAILLQVAVVGTLLCAASAGGAAIAVAGWLLVAVVWLLAWLAFLPMMLIAGVLLALVSVIFLLAQFGVELVRFLRQQPPAEGAAAPEPLELALPTPPTLHLPAVRADAADVRTHQDRSDLDVAVGPVARVAPPAAATAAEPTTATPVPVANGHAAESR